MGGHKSLRLEGAQVKSDAEVQDFATAARTRLIEPCPFCKGVGLSDCACMKRVGLEVAAFEACIPRDFWDSTEKDVVHNRANFTDVVQAYTRKLGTANKHGYGLIFLGDNGVGKTMFMSYVLMAAVRKGLSAYYTSMPQLDYDIKRGFNDPAAHERLRVMFTVDFLAIDELGKERFKTGDNFLRLHLERILKQRFDDNAPTLLATNMEMTELETEYGRTLLSIIIGKYTTVLMEAGDYREHLKERMTKRMGFGR